MTEAPPFMFADVSAWQPVPDPSLLGPPWVGVFCKATEGLYYAPEWFLSAWAAMRKRPEILLGWYHFLHFSSDGAKQADYALGHVEKAGGMRCGDIRGVVDVERNKYNTGASAGQVIDCTSAFSARYHEITGHLPILYGRGCMRDLGIRSKMGCDGVWDPDYEQHMNMIGLEAWTVDDVLLWQITEGTKRQTPEGLPWQTPIGGDVNVYVQGAQKPDWPTLARRMCVP